MNAKGQASLILTPEQEGPMVELLGTRRIPITKVKQVIFLSLTSFVLEWILKLCETSTSNFKALLLNFQD